MHDTSAPNLSAWSGLAAPLCCLASKSQARLCSESLQRALEANLSGPGSMIYQTVWKPHVTPLGRQIYRLRASGRRTSDSEPSLVPSGWRTPMAEDTRERKNVGYIERRKTLKFPITTSMEAVWQLSGWPTPNAVNGDSGAYKDFDKLMARKAAGRQTNLQEIVMVAGWPTPMAGTPAQNGNNEAGNNDSSRKTVALSGWPPPTTRDHKDGKECPNVPLNALLGRVAWLAVNPQAARITADGRMLTGCSAGMESGGQLNPAFSAWLMGFPEAWCHAAISCQLPARLRKAPKKPVV